VRSQTTTEGDKMTERCFTCLNFTHDEEMLVNDGSDYVLIDLCEIGEDMDDGDTCSKYVGREND